MTVREILARRESIRTEMRAIHDANPSGVLAGEAESRWNTLSAEAEALNGAERRQASLDDLDRRAAGSPVAGTGNPDNRFDELRSAVTILDVVRAQMGGTDVASGRAREVSAELAKRSGRAANGLFWDMSTAAAAERRTFLASGSGSNLIQTTVSPDMIDRLRNRVLVRQLGATVLGGLVGNLSIPRLDTSTQAYWVAENTAITESDPVFDSVSLTPHQLGALTSVSRNMIQQSSLDVTRLVETDMAKILAVALDAAAITGGGTNQPSGLLASGSGITIVPGATNGAAPSWANIVALIGAVDASNALDGNSLAFLTNAKVTKAMRTTLKTTADTSSNFIMTDPNSLAGYNLGSSQNVPSTLAKGTGTNLSAMVFGDWSQLLLGFWSELDILVNPYDSTAYASGAVLVRAMLTADIKIKQPLAFAALTDLIAP